MIRRTPCFTPLTCDCGEEVDESITVTDVPGLWVPVMVSGYEGHLDVVSELNHFNQDVLPRQPRVSSRLVLNTPS